MYLTTGYEPGAYCFWDCGRDVAGRTREWQVQKPLSHPCQDIKEAWKRQSSLQTLTAKRRQLLCCGSQNKPDPVSPIHSQGTVCVCVCACVRACVCVCVYGGGNPASSVNRREISTLIESQNSGLKVIFYQLSQVKTGRLRARVQNSVARLEASLMPSLQNTSRLHFSLASLCPPPP